MEIEQHFVELDRMALQEKRHLIEEILGNANSVDDASLRLSEALNYHHDLYVLVQRPPRRAHFSIVNIQPQCAKRRCPEYRGDQCFRGLASPRYRVPHIELWNCPGLLRISVAGVDRSGYKTPHPIPHLSCAAVWRST